jgi:phenylalanine-4-hydroxylase
MADSAPLAVVGVNGGAMTAQPRALTSPVFTEEDHQTWATLYKRQFALVKGCACRLFLDSLPRLQLDPERLPDPQVFSERLSRMTGWTLGDAQNEYLGPTEWFEHIAERRFPVTNYIRRPHEIDFTPLPDLFHEFFGHLAFFTDPAFGDMAQMFGPLFLSTVNDRQRLEISRLWWFSLEFGLIREDGDVKIYGAGLLSSPGELAHALDPATPRYEFDVRKVAETQSAAYSFHEGYFILDDYDHPIRIVEEYAREEGLPVPPR